MGQAERDAWNRVLAVLVTGGAAGAGIRGLMGMRNLMRGRPKVDTQSSIPVPVPIKTPQPEHPGYPKLAGLGARSSGRVNWWEIPMYAAGGAGGLYGGWKLMDWLMDKQRKGAVESELSTAKKDYESALQDQYNAAMMGKGASAEPTLDDVFDHISNTDHVQEHMEKIAAGIIPESWSNTAGDLAHGGAGLYLTALMALTGLSGVGAYNWTKSKSKAKAMEEAIKKRRMMRSAPQPLLAVPQYQPPPMSDERNPQGM